MNAAPVSTTVRVCNPEHVRFGMVGVTRSAPTQQGEVIVEFTDGALRMVSLSDLERL